MKKRYRPHRLDIVVPVVDQEVPRADTDQIESGPLMITHQSPRRHRKAVYTLAQYFRREFSYDFVDYDPDSSDPECEAWLWINAYEGFDGRSYGIGHATFWRDTYEGRPSGEWTLAAVWLHPYFRREGRLTDAWQVWRERYGDFWVETPWSKSMQAFLIGSGHHFYDGRAAVDVLHGGASNPTL